jgi:hypothetical protein
LFSAITQPYCRPFTSEKKETVLKGLSDDLKATQHNSIDTNENIRIASLREGTLKKLLGHIRQKILEEYILNRVVLQKKVLLSLFW